MNLKNCPCCGHEAVFGDDSPEDCHRDGPYFIYCGGCGLSTDTQITPEDAIVAGSKIAYLSALTLNHSPKFYRFDRKADLSSLHINTRDDLQRLERLKKSSIEAFYYYFQTLELLS